jgi:hypothetical protein
MSLKLAKSVLLALVVLVAPLSIAQQAGALGEPIVLQTTSLPKGFLRQPYHFKLEAQGGILPLKWEITAGAQPPGIDLSPDGNLTGAPAEVDSFHFVVTFTKKRVYLRRCFRSARSLEQNAQGQWPKSGRLDQSLQPD